VVTIVFPVRRRVGWLIVAGAVVVFAAMAVQAHGGNPSWDRAVFSWFHHQGVPGDYTDGVGWLMLHLTTLGEVPVSRVVALTLLVLMGVLRQPRAMVFVVVVPLLGAQVANELKPVFAYPRPDLVYQYEPTHTYSFPSGHTAGATVVWLTVAVLLARFLTGRIAKAAALACLVVPLLVALSRVYLGVHWPTDVVAGLAFGVAWVLTSYLLVFETGRQADHPGEPATAEPSGES